MQVAGDTKTTIQMASALAMLLVQSVATLPEEGPAAASIEDAAAAAAQQGFRPAILFSDVIWATLMDRAAVTRQQRAADLELDWKQLLCQLIDDVAAVLYSPEWPAAHLMMYRRVGRRAPSFGLLHCKARREGPGIRQAGWRSPSFARIFALSHGASRAPVLPCTCRSRLDPLCSLLWRLGNKDLPREEAAARALAIDCIGSVAQAIFGSAQQAEEDAQWLLKGPLRPTGGSLGVVPPELSDLRACNDLVAHAERLLASYLAAELQEQGVSGGRH